MANETQEILTRLQKIEQALRRIQRCMPDRDMFLSSEEKQLVEESFERETHGQLLSSAEARRQLGL